MQWIIVTIEPINDGQLQWDRLCAKRVWLSVWGDGFSYQCRSNDFAVGSAIGFRAYVNAGRLESRMMFCEGEITRNEKELEGAYEKWPSTIPRLGTDMGITGVRRETTHKHSRVHVSPSINEDGFDDANNILEKL
jgi:hypothetical protein